jgi:hypothetical protein
MADLTKPTVSAVSVVQVIEQHTLPVEPGTTIEAGQLVGINSSGRLVLADADTGPVLTKGIALTSSAKTGGVVTFLQKGLVDVGNILSGLAFLASVYSSGTAGLMADAAVGGLAAVAEVVPVWGASSAADRLLRFDL